MGCRICGRAACTESFHTIAEQENHPAPAEAAEKETDRLAAENAALREKLATADLRIAEYARASKHDEETIDKLTAERDELLDGNEGSRVYCGQFEAKLAAAEAAQQWRGMESAPKDAFRGAILLHPGESLIIISPHDLDSSSLWTQITAPPLPPAPGGER